MSAEVPARSVPVRRKGGRKLRELWSARELLKNMVVRDIKVRYKGSILGFGWTMLTPLAMMIVFTFIFTHVFRGGPPDFSVFFLSGFLPWIYFSNSVVGSVGAIVNNGNLIKKVYFPREVLPLATVMSQAVHFVLSLGAFAVYMLYEGYNFLPFLPLILLAFALLTAFSSGLAMAFAAANVGFRDLQELLTVVFLVWFYSTPVIYDLSMVPDRFRSFLLLNPMTWFVDLFRYPLYRLTLPPGRALLVCSGFAVVSLGLGATLFSRLAASFAKEV